MTGGMISVATLYGRLRPTIHVSRAFVPPPDELRHYVRELGLDLHDDSAQSLGLNVGLNVGRNAKRIPADWKTSQLVAWRTRLIKVAPPLCKLLAEWSCKWRLNSPIGEITSPSRSAPPSCPPDPDLHISSNTDNPCEIINRG